MEKEYLNIIISTILLIIIFGIPILKLFIYFVNWSDNTNNY